MFKLKKVVDEREEYELLRIEHFAFWAMFLTAIASIVIQLTFLDLPLEQTYGEYAIMFIGASFIIGGCIKKGHWSFYSSPSKKHYFLYSLGTASFILLIMILSKAHFRASFKHEPFMALAIASIIFGSMFLLTYVSLFAAGKIVKRKREKLEQDYLE